MSEKKVAMEKRLKRNSYTSPNMPTEARVENNAALKAVKNSIGTDESSPETTSQEPLLGLVGQKPAQHRSTPNAKRTAVSSMTRQENSSRRAERRMNIPMGRTCFICRNPRKAIAMSVTKTLSKID